MKNLRPERFNKINLHVESFQGSYISFVLIIHLFLFQLTEIYNQAIQIY